MVFDDATEIANENNSQVQILKRSFKARVPFGERQPTSTLIPQNHSFFSRYSPCEVSCIKHKVKKMDNHTKAPKRKNE